MSDSVQTPTRRILRAVLLVAAVAAIFYTFSGRAEQDFGSVKPAAERKPMPPLTMPSMTGETWNLDAHRGQVVLVNFWATWCPPCRAETPGFVKLADKYRGEGFEIVGVTLDEDPRTAVPPFVQQFRVTYPILVPTADSALANAIQSLPTSLLIDKQGRVARTYHGAVPERVLERDFLTLRSE